MQVTSEASTLVSASEPMLPLSKSARLYVTA